MAKTEEEFQYVGVPSTRPYPGLQQHVSPDVHSKQVSTARPYPGLQQDLNPDVHRTQIPSTRPHPDLQHDLNPEVHVKFAITPDF